MTRAPTTRPRRRKGPHYRFEKACGEVLVCGVDEAGRGPWAGPVVAAAVILNPKKVPKGLDDSKKLTAQRREELELEIKAKALAWAVGSCDVEEIGMLNILHASGRAMLRAVEQLAPQPVVALIDGNYRFPMPCEVRTVVGGDALSVSIAAASILAKVERDRRMIAYDGEFPGYGFAQHKGYGVPQHAAAVKSLGPTPIHRLTFPRLRRVLGLDQLELDFGLDEAAMAEDAA
jgi:ribonuclease HII